MPLAWSQMYIQLNEPHNAITGAAVGYFKTTYYATFRA